MSFQPSNENMSDKLNNDNLELHERRLMNEEKGFVATVINLSIANKKNQTTLPLPPIDETKTHLPHQVIKATFFVKKDNQWIAYSALYHLYASVFTKPYKLSLKKFLEVQANSVLYSKRRTKNPLKYLNKIELPTSHAI